MATPLDKGIDTNGVLIRWNGVTAFGLLQSAGGSLAPGITAEARDGDGNVSAAKRSDWRGTHNITYIQFSGVAMPQKNDIVQVVGFQDSDLNGAYRVIAAGEEYTNQGYPTKPLTLHRYIDNGVPSATTTTTTTTTT